jgi:N-acetylglucosamine kinase-like BadF-type ATPase
MRSRGSHYICRSNKLRYFLVFALQYLKTMSGVVICSDHRNSTALLLKEDTVVGPFSTASLNHHSVLYADLVLAYNRILHKCVSGFDCKSVAELSERSDFILVCLPGAATEFDKQIVISLLVRCGWAHAAISRIFVVDDTWAGAVAASKTNEVIYGIADSGCSVFVFTGDFPPGRTAKFDGWGALIGDHGGKFQLSLDALRLICKDLDRRGSPSLLTLLRQFDEDLRLLPDLQLWFDNLLNSGHTVWRQKVADLANPLLTAADTAPGDHPDALRLVQEAATSFANTLDITIRSFSPDSHNLDITVGGTMMECRVFRERLHYEVERRFSRTLRLSDLTVTAGALLMAKSLPSCIPSAIIRETAIAAFDAAPEAIRELLYEPWSSQRRKGAPL